MRVYLASPAQLYQYPVRVPLERILLSFVKSSWPKAKFEQVLTNTTPSRGYSFDSGAHVWLSAYFKSHEKPPVEQVEKHLTNFMAMTESLSRRPDFVVDLDVQKIYGLSLIQAWRRDLWASFEDRTGIRVCYVWHPADGEAVWNAMLADPKIRYLGMGSAFKVLPTEKWAQLVYRAYEAGKPVHGFAKVSSKFLRQIPFYSVDSTSWAAGTFFGTVPEFDSLRGYIKHNAVGDRANRNVGSKVVSARLAAVTGGKIRSSLLQGGASGKDFAYFYQHAAAVYVKFESWFTSYWCARGLDWDRRLIQAGNLPPG